MRSSRLEKATQRQYAKIQSELTKDGEVKLPSPREYVQGVLGKIGISIDDFADGPASKLAQAYQQKTGHALEYSNDKLTDLQREILAQI